MKQISAVALGGSGAGQTMYFDLAKVAARAFITNEVYLEQPEIVLRHTVDLMSVELSGQLLVGRLSSDGPPLAVCTHFHGGHLAGHIEAMLRSRP